MHLAQLIDEMRWLRFAVYHAQGGKPKKPDQYPRPGVPLKRKKTLSSVQRDYLDEIRANRAPAPAPLIPPHIAQANAKKLGPAERAWLARQLAAMRATPPPP